MEHITTTQIQQTMETVVTLGNFDGMHLGHRALIEKTKEKAKEKGLRSVVFTFAPHPKLVFGKKEEFALIMSPEEKLFTMESMGLDLYIEYPFDTDFASMSPEAFVNDLLFYKLQCKVLIVGEDYHFGAKRQGDFAMLKQMGKEQGVEVISVPSVTFEDTRVSSSRIRQCLINKELEQANRMLTVPYFILGTVAQGKKLGRTIGFPTVNIVAHPLKLFPPNGVYATKTLYNGKYYYGVTNIGINPTVEGTQKIVETYLLDFNQSIYGEELQTFFYHFLRKEKKFSGIEELCQQIKKNAQQARQYFITDAYNQCWKQDGE